MKQIILGMIGIVIALWIHPLVGIFLVAGVGLRYQSPSYEIIVVGTVIDIAFGSVLSFGWIYLPMYTLGSIVLFVVLLMVKKRMNIYV